MSKDIYNDLISMDDEIDDGWGIEHEDNLNTYNIDDYYDCDDDEPKELDFSH